MIAEHHSHERRQFPRSDASLPVKIIQEDGDIVTETVNISRAGAYCKTEKFVEPMTKLKICLLLPGIKGSGSTGKKISCEGIVVRIEPISHENAFNMAIFFNDLSQRESELISEYVNAQIDV